MHGHTIPRLELCAAVLATEIADIIRDQLKIHQDNFLFFTDCQVVLGYISNETKRFYIYVANRVGRIRLFSQQSQWHFFSEQNIILQMLLSTVLMRHSLKIQHGFVAKGSR